MAVEVLELVLDASGMQRGAQQAGEALNAVGQRATTAATAVTNTGRAMSAAFQVGGGSVQIASGIAQTANAFGQLNTQAALFSASRVLLEVGNTARDFGNLRSAIGGVTGVMGALGAVIRANPIGSIATVVGLAATAMSLFGSRTRQATEEIKKQTTALDSLLGRVRDLDVRRGYGERDPRTTPAGTVDALTALRLSDRQQIDVRDAAGLFGIDEQNFRYALGRSGLGESAIELRRRDSILWDTRAALRGENQFAMQSISRDQAIAAGELLLRDRRPAEVPLASDAGDMLRARQFSSGFAAAREAQLDSERRAREEAIAHAERIADILGGAGNELGQALFAAVEGGAGALRTALANLLSSWGQRGFGAAFDAVGRAVAGATTRQSQPAATGGGGTVV